MLVFSTENHQVPILALIKHTADPAYILVGSYGLLYLYIIYKPVNIYICMYIDRMDIAYIYAYKFNSILWCHPLMVMPTLTPSTQGVGGGSSTTCTCSGWPYYGGDQDREACTVLCINKTSEIQINYESEQAIQCIHLQRYTSTFRGVPLRHPHTCCFKECHYATR